MTQHTKRWKRAWHRTIGLTAILLALLIPMGLVAAGDDVHAETTGEAAVAADVDNQPHATMSLTTHNSLPEGNCVWLESATVTHNVGWDSEYTVLEKRVLTGINFGQNGEILNDYLGPVYPDLTYKLNNSGGAREGRNIYYFSSGFDTSNVFASPFTYRRRGDSGYWQNWAWHEDVRAMIQGPDDSNGNSVFYAPVNGQCGTEPLDPPQNPGNNCANNGDKNGFGDPVSLNNFEFFWATDCGNLSGNGSVNIFLNYSSYASSEGRGTNNLPTGWLVAIGSRSLKTERLGGACVGNTCHPFVDVAHVYSEEGFKNTYEKISGTNNYKSPDGNFSSLVHDPNTDLYTLTYRNGTVEVYNATGEGEINSITDRYGNRFEMNFDNVNGIYTIENMQNGQKVLYEHEAITDDLHIGLPWRLTTIKQLDSNGNLLRQMTLTYDDDGSNAWANLVKVTDFEGNVHTFDYDNQGRIIRYYDPNNNPDSKPVVDYLTNNYAGYSYKVISQTLPSGSVVTYQENEGASDYDLIVTTNPGQADERVNRFLREYITIDGNSVPTYRLARVYQVNSTTDYTEMDYDYKNQMVWRVDPEGRRAEFAYNESGGPLTGGDLIEVRACHDLTDCTDPANYDTTQMAYDDFGQLTVLTDTLGYVTEWNYDANDGSLLSTVMNGSDGSSQVTNFITNQYGKVTHVQLPDGTWNVQAYDSLGYPTTTTYDANHGGNTGRLTLTEQLDFDERGFLVAATNLQGTKATYEVNDLGWTTAAVFDDVAGGRQTRTEYDYDNVGNVITITEDVGGLNLVTTYEWEFVGIEGRYAPVRIVDAEGNVTHLEYTSHGELRLAVTEGLIDENGNTYNRAVQYNYTPEGWLDTIEVGTANSQLITNSYSQWAHEVLGYNSQYNSTFYAAVNVLGSPDGKTWLSLYWNSSGEYLSVEYMQGVYATGATINESGGNGYVTQIDGIDISGNLTTLWTGTDPTPNTGNIEAFNVTWPKTNFLVKGLKIYIDGTLDMNSTESMESVQLHGELLPSLEWTFTSDRTVIDYDYNTAGQVTAITDARGVKNEYTYDDKGRLWQEKLGTAAVGSHAAVNGVFTYSYDGLDRVTSVSGPNNWTYTYDYTDPYGRLAWEENAVGDRVTYTYDPARNWLDTVVVGNGGEAIATDYTYDPLARLQQVVLDPTGENIMAQYAYTDPNSNDEWNLQKVIDPRGNATTYTYNSFGLVETVTDAHNETWTYSYDDLGRLIQMMDARGNATTYTPDPLGRTADLIRAGRTESWDYNPDGTLDTYTDFAGGTTQYKYDQSGRLTYIDYPEPNEGNYAPGTVSAGFAQYAYTANDLLATVTDPHGTTTYTYDALNRLASRERDNRTVSYDYNANSWLEKLTYWNGEDVDYGYNNAGQLTSLNPWNNGASSFTYRSTGQLETQNRPNNVDTTYGYDTAGRMDGILSQNGATTLEHFQYQFDPNGNRTQISEMAGTTTYTYDDLNRLETENYPAIAGGPGAEAVVNTYDAVGNRTSSTNASTKLETVEVANVDDGGWTTVNTQNSYSNMVVACSLVYQNNNKPAVIRMQNAAGSSFQIKLQAPKGDTLVSDKAHCLVAEEGAWTLPDGRKFEAQKYLSTVTDSYNVTGWNGEQQTYVQSYTNPVVFGQVMSFNDSQWSTFWSRGVDRYTPASSATLYTGKHIGTVPSGGSSTRVDETVGFIVMEAGSGVIDGVEYAVGLTDENIEGVGSMGTTSYPYTFATPFSTIPTRGVVTIATMNGGEGGWSYLMGDSALSTSVIETSNDENADRTHYIEHVAYFVTTAELIISKSLLETVEVASVDDDGWTTVNTQNSYSNMVVACSLVYQNNNKPTVIRMQNAAGSSFQIKLQAPKGDTLVSDKAHCLVAEEGAWTLPDGRKFEAQKYLSTVTDSYNVTGWNGEQQTYVQSYTSPVVFGQVMSYNDSQWSTFWSRGVDRYTPASSATLYTGKHIGTVPSGGSSTRVDETVGFIVMEAGSGVIDGVEYAVGLTDENIEGVGSMGTTSYPYTFATPFSTIPMRGVVTIATMNGGEGGWSYLMGNSALSTSVIETSNDENTDRTHYIEHVAYFVTTAEIDSVLVDADSMNSPAFVVDGGSPYTGVLASLLSLPLLGLGLVLRRKDARYAALSGWVCLIFGVLVLVGPHTAALQPATSVVDNAATELVESDAADAAEAVDEDEESELLKNFDPLAYQSLNPAAPSSPANYGSPRPEAFVPGGMVTGGFNR